MHKNQREKVLWGYRKARCLYVIIYTLNLLVTGTFLCIQLSRRGYSHFLK